MYWTISRLLMNHCKSLLQNFATLDITMGVQELKYAHEIHVAGRK